MPRVHVPVADLCAFGGLPGTSAYHAFGNCYCKRCAVTPFEAIDGADLRSHESYVSARSTPYAAQKLLCVYYKHQGMWYDVTRRCSEACGGGLGCAGTEHGFVVLGADPDTQDRPTHRCMTCRQGACYRVWVGEVMILKYPNQAAYDRNELAPV